MDAAQAEIDGFTASKQQHEQRFPLYIDQAEYQRFEDGMKSRRDRIVDMQPRMDELAVDVTKLDSAIEAGQAAREQEFSRLSRSG